MFSQIQSDGSDNDESQMLPQGSGFRRARTLLVIVFVLLALGYGAFRLHYWCNPFGRRFFDQKVWLAHTEDFVSINPRASMVLDLRWRYLRRGMTRNQVKELLGTPDWEQRNDLFSYYIGQWSGLRMDPDSLDIYFDSDGQLTNVRRVQH